MTSVQSSYTPWRRSSDEDGTFVNDNGDKAVFLFKTIAIVNGEVLYGFDLFQKLSELAKR